MDALGDRRAVRTSARFARGANRDDGGRAVMYGIFNVETGWHKGRGAQATGHGVDSFMKPTQAGAQTSSKVSQSPTLTPFDNL